MMRAVWQAVIVVLVGVATLVSGVPLADTPGDHSVQHTKKINSTPVIAEASKVTKKQRAVKLPANSSLVPFFSNRLDTILPCSTDGFLPYPFNCSFFYSCNNNDDELKINMYMCSNGNVFYQNAFECVAGICVDDSSENVVVMDSTVDTQGHISMHPPAPSPFPQPPYQPFGPPQWPGQVPEWFNNMPVWFNSAPWWFNTAPSWFSKLPTGLNLQSPSPPGTKPTMDEGVVGVGGEESGAKVNQVKKTIILGHDSTVDVETHSAYEDKKGLSIHIPIIIQT